MSDSMRPKAGDYVPPCMDAENPGPHVVGQVRCGACGRLDAIPKEKRAVVGEALGLSGYLQVIPPKSSNDPKKDEIAKAAAMACIDYQRGQKTRPESIAFTAIIKQALSDYEPHNADVDRLGGILRQTANVLSDIRGVQLGSWEELPDAVSQALRETSGEGAK